MTTQATESIAAQDLEPGKLLCWQAMIRVLRELQVTATVSVDTDVSVDLGWEEFDRLHFVNLLEAELGLTIPNPDLHGCNRLGQYLQTCFEARKVRLAAAAAGTPANAAGSGELTIEERVIEIVAEQTGINKKQITLEHSLASLGCDSLDAVELVMEFEEEFDITVPKGDIEKLQTVGQCVTYIEQHAS